MDKQIIKSKEISNNVLGISSVDSAANDISMPDNGNINFSKPFKSRYINETGKWSRKAVDEGMVDFDDYIKDIETEQEDMPNFNNKVLTVKKPKTDMNYNNQVNKKKSDLLYDYTLSDTNPVLTASFSDYMDSVKQKGEATKHWIDRGKWTLINLG